MRRGEIWYVDLGIPSGGVGHEQAGDRPALLVLNDAPVSPLIMAIPITGQTSAKKFPHTILINPSKQNGLSNPSVILVFQLRALDKKRLRRKLGVLECGYQEKVDIELSILLDLHN